MSCAKQVLLRRQPSGEMGGAAIVQRALGELTEAELGAARHRRGA